MDLFTPLLLSLCINTPNTYNTACQKSVEASYIQTGWAIEVNTFQSGVASYGTAKEKAVFGKSTGVINTVFMAGIAAKNKRVNLTLPNLGLCDSFSTELRPNNYGFRWEWSW